MTTTTGAAPMSAEQIVALDRLTHLIASELARIDGFDPDDQHGGLYDLRWQSGSMPEPLGDAWSMDYLPKAERIARTAVSAIAEREAALIAERDGYKSGWLDIVEMLGGKKLTDISNAQYHASVLVPKIRELIALSAERDALIKEVEALRAKATALCDALDSGADPRAAYLNLRAAIDAARAESGHD